MTRNLKTLRRLADARERLRDAEAQKVADAERIRRERDAIESRISATAGRIQSEAPERLLGARAIVDLEIVAMDVTAAAAAAKEARTQATAARQLAEQATGRLREKERELRMAQKLVSRVRGEIEIEADKREQRMADDLAGARARRTA